jgi:hypothetical protein
MNHEDELFELLLESGAIQIFSINEETGEAVYRVTDIYKDMFPELYKLHMAELSDVVNGLWQKGLLEIDFTDTDEKVSFHPHNFLKYVELKDTLNQEELDIIHVFFPKEETE